MKKREKPRENKAGSLLKDEKERKRVMQANIEERNQQVRTELWKGQKNNIYMENE